MDLVSFLFELRLLAQLSLVQNVCFLSLTGIKLTTNARGY